MRARRGDRADLRANRCSARQIFRDYYGPTHKAFAALDGAKQNALEADIVALLERFNVAGRDSLVVPGEYLEVVITKQDG